MTRNQRGCVAFYPVDKDDCECTVCDHSGDNGQCAFFLRSHKCTEGLEEKEEEEQHEVRHREC